MQRRLGSAARAVIGAQGDLARRRRSSERRTGVNPGVDAEVHLRADDAAAAPTYAAPMKGAGKITVVLADDQRVVREALSMVLSLIPGVEVLASACDGEAAIALVSRLAPQVALMDLRMPRVDGVQATRTITERHPQTKVVVLTTYADDRTVIQALRAGACGFLTKDASGAQIGDALAAAVRGEAAIDPAVQHHLVRSIAKRGPGGWTPPDAPRLPDGLTPREAEVLELIADGLSNAEIAERLVVTGTTVKSHVNHIYGKTGARDRAQAAAYAYRNGLVAAPGAPDT
jgi:DNA-binding NarL/FixJ family response regulator